MNVEQRKTISAYVKKWIDSHEPDTFARTANGNILYSAGHSTINLVAFFENLLVDFVEESENE